ncbi:MAG: sigma-54 interaction domain-containing protein [Planctomycetota bacterium]|jgi:DNA-binding NtrC family response regulator
MAAGLFVLSGDVDFVNELRSRFSPRFELVVADSIEHAQTLDKSPVHAALAHVNARTLNGHTPKTFWNKLKQVVPTAPIYGLVEPGCPTEHEAAASKTAQECLPFPVDYDHLGQLLDSHSPLAAAFGEYYAGMPHRALYGQTRSLVTFTPSMFQVFDELKVAAAHHVTILLIGETGSGKSHLARVIHELSGRRGERCLTVACGALPPDLIESELFGYVKGAFTGADADKPGKFAAAQQGTLLMDEIDVLAPEQQAKLLRVIETGEYEPVGSNETQTSTARLIAASNIDLEQLVEAGKFRVDLYYRLNTISFHLPPLRDRPWDIEFLARKFALEHGRSHNIRLGHIEPEFLGALRQYRWPGNIRELENVIRRAVLYCRDGVLTVADLPSSIRPAAAKVFSGGKGSPRPSGNGNGDGRTMPTLEQRISQIERRIIEESLQRHHFNRTDTAKELGISRVTLYNKMKKLGMSS